MGNSSFQATTSGWIPNKRYCSFLLENPKSSLYGVNGAWHILMIRLKNWIWKRKRSQQGLCSEDVVSENYKAPHWSYFADDHCSEQQKKIRHIEKLTENVWTDSNKPNPCDLARVPGTQEERWVEDETSKKRGRGCLQTTVCRWKDNLK